MLVVFMLDTSASMNQRCNNGLTLLDCAKSAIEHFHKVRLRDTSVRMDRYMLVTCEEGSNAIRVLDKYPFLNFMHVLKGIQARDLTSIGASLQRVFSFLHLQHLATDIDKFGQGRYPCLIDPTTVMLLTDGTELTSMSGVLPTVSQSLLPSSPAPVGAELLMQPFRWDQRVFATVLRIPSVSQALLERNGSMPQNAVAMDNSISALCESTGGKCFVAASWKILLQHIELTASRLASSVIVSFEQMLAPGSAALPPQVPVTCQRKVMFVRGGQMLGHWPIPESFWPDSSHPELPPREPHPVIAYKAVDTDSYIPANFIFDKYEIENNSFMSLAHKGSVGACWQVFIRNSKCTNHGFGDPFGFIRLNHGGSLTLFVLPYNYPVLWQLLKQVVKIPGSTSAKTPLIPQWRQDMERYCNSIPAYYGTALRLALKRWGLHAHIVPESIENPWVSFVGAHLKRLKAQAKADLDLEMSRILTDDHLMGSNSSTSASLTNRFLPIITPGSPQNSDAPPGFVSSPSNVSPSMQITPMSIRTVGHTDQFSARKGWEASVPLGPSSNGWQSLPGVSLSSGHGNIGSHTYGNGATNSIVSSQWGTGTKKDNIFKNPFDISRDQLIRQLINLPIRVASALEARRNQGTDKGCRKPKSALSLLAAGLVAREEDESRHSLPVEKMGDFNEALLKQQPPRNPFADELDRNKQLKSMFGNPYRQERSDGADEAWQEGMSGPLSRGRKRRRRPEVLGVCPSSPGSTEAGFEVGPGKDSAPLAKILSDSQGINEEVTSLSINLHNVKPKEKTLETMDGQDSTPPVQEILVRKDRYVEIGDGIVEDIRRPLPIEDKEKDHLNVEAGSFEHPEESTTVGLDNVEEMLQSGQKRVAVVTSLGTRKDQHDVAGFIITVLRTLRHTRPSNTQKLFEILSTPDFPVDKCSLLEQLIQQAHRYNKRTVAKELSDYRSQILCRVASAVGKA